LNSFQVYLPNTEFLINLGDWPLIKKGGKKPIDLIPMIRWQFHHYFFRRILQESYLAFEDFRIKVDWKLCQQVQDRRPRRHSLAHILTNWSFIKMHGTVSQVSICLVTNTTGWRYQYEPLRFSVINTKGSR